MMLDKFGQNYKINKKQKNNMGPLPSKEFCDEDLKKYEESLQFIMNKQTPQFGTIRIYKMLEKPYEYLMRKTYYGLSNDPAIFKKYEWYRTMEEDKKSVGIDFLNITQRQGPCGKTTELSLFCKYYYFTLQDAIDKKMRKQNHFSEEQIIYILESLLHLNKQFHRTTHQYLGFFKTSQIFITPQGFIKIYPFISQWSLEFDQNNSEQDLDRNKSYTKYTTENQYEFSLNLEKEKIELDSTEGLMKTRRDDVKDIGIVILEILTLAKQFDYKTKDYRIKENIIQFILNQNSCNNIGIFRNLLKGLIFENQAENEIEREIRNFIQTRNLTKTFCLKLNNDSQTEQSRVVERPEQWEEIKKNKLSRISNRKLVAGTISSLRLSSQF